MNENYADQRGHDVAWLTAAGREALGRRKAAALTAAVDAIEGEPGESVTGPVRAHLAALYDQAVTDTRGGTR